MVAPLDIIADII
jgi:hypothetical protein